MAPKLRTIGLISCIRQEALELSHGTTIKTIGLCFFYILVFLTIVVKWACSLSLLCPFFNPSVGRIKWKSTKNLTSDWEASQRLLPVLGAVVERHTYGSVSCSREASRSDLDLAPSKASRPSRHCSEFLLLFSCASATSQVLVSREAA